MRRLKLTAKILFITFVTTGLLFGGLAVYGWEKVWVKVAGLPDLGPVSFENLILSGSPNQALICPADLCRTSDIDLVSPVYALPPRRLREELLNSLRGEENLVRVDDGKDPLQLRFVQRSTWFRFPDTIRVSIMPLEGERSTLALYSQSQIGESDFGINFNRLKRWIRRIETYEVER